MKTETGLVRGHWTTEGFSISMSIDSSTDNFGPEVIKWYPTGSGHCTSGGACWAAGCCISFLRMAREVLALKYVVVVVSD